MRNYPRGYFADLARKNNRKRTRGRKYSFVKNGNKTRKVWGIESPNY